MRKNSPFPGMDPYLERYWGDIHHSLVQYVRDQIQEQLPSNLRARVEERIFLESDEGWSRNVYPDVRIFQRPGTETTRAREESVGNIAVAEPLILQMRNDPITEGYIEIRDGESGNKVITVIEVLSPANKAGGNGTMEYLQKQHEVLSGKISLVEIDLLRKGRHITAVPWEFVPEPQRSLFHVCVKRGWRYKEVEFYCIGLRDRLSTVAIPLRPQDQDVRLDLQALIDQAYRMGRYGDIDYTKPLDPPLEPADAAWAAALAADSTV